MTVPTPSGATPPKQPPNVLMIVLDTVSHEALFDGDNIDDNTPYLKKLAGESLVYESAYSTSPWTLPSHASLLTGQLPSQHNASWTTALPSHVPTITQWLSKQNYQTGAFVANHWYCSRETGIGRGFGHFDDEQITASTFLSAAAWSRRFVPVMLGCVGIVSDPCKTQRRSAATIHQRAERWIRSKSKQPWFAMVNLFDAHDPYIAPGTRNQLSDLEFRKLKFWWDRNKQNVSDSNVKLQQTKYRECLAYVDKEIGRFLNRLIETSHLKNTIVIITADHGEHFGDHDLYGHGNSLYQPLIHIPLMIWASPDLMQRKGVEKQNVSLCDIPATISNLVSPNSSHPFPGKDLLAKNYSATPVFGEIQTPSLWPACHGRSPVFRGAMKCVVWNGYKYIRTGEDEEVYKISTDEAESVNLVDHVEANTLTELRRLINKQYPPQ